ncbi:hypothetical protein, partial [Cellulomonas sp. B6]|uniref:hypothetical protein n=1 Tax=Cellulomonas sp. B6 TaxID=1295626 RepID=UPI000AC6D6D4
HAAGPRRPRAEVDPAWTAVETYVAPLVAEGADAVAVRAAPAGPGPRRPRAEVDPAWTAVETYVAPLVAEGADAVAVR